MFNLIRKFKGRKKEGSAPKEYCYFYIFMKPWPARLSISFDTVNKYIIVSSFDGENFTFIDQNEETNGFESYRGAEQFLRAYLTIRYNEYPKLPKRWYINKYKMANGGYLKDKKGKKIDY